MSAIKEIPSDEAFVAQRHRVGNTENQIADLMEHHEGKHLCYKKVIAI